MSAMGGKLTLAVVVAKSVEGAAFVRRGPKLMKPDAIRLFDR
jgi:hypothetical protein